MEMHQQSQQPEVKEGAFGRSDSIPAEMEDDEEEARLKFQNDHDQ